MGALREGLTERHAKRRSCAHEEGPHDVSPHPTQEIAVRSAHIRILRLRGGRPRVWKRSVTVRRAAEAAGHLVLLGRVRALLASGLTRPLVFARSPRGRPGGLTTNATRSPPRGERKPTARAMVRSTPSPSARVAAGTLPSQPTRAGPITDRVLVLRTQAGAPSNGVDS